MVVTRTLRLVLVRIEGQPEVLTRRAADAGLRRGMDMHKYAGRVIGAWVVPGGFA
jgi:hypothetical protein